jgi:ABC-type multidrug transport system fused ATPase/permease subunit
MVALILSILMPGLGQFYYGKNIRAICMILLGLTPLYPLVLIWTIIDIIILNRKGSVPVYRARDAIWAIVILAIIIPIFIAVTATGLYYVGSWYSETHVLPAQTKSEIRKISSAISEFNTAHGYFPDSLSELIINHPLRSGWLKDSWGEPYIYKKMDDREDIQLISKGPDKELNTEDDLSTIVSETLGTLLK